MLTLKTSASTTPLRYWAGGDGASLAVKLASASLTPTPGAILDFVATLSTSERDRDGDKMLSAGAELEEKMPLLWQHKVDSPVGRMVAVRKRDSNSIQCQFCIANTPLGRGAATLLRMGVLRMSHGFRPLKAVPQPDGRGWKISSWSVVEASLVSIPANRSAEVVSVIEATKSFGGATPEARALVASLTGDNE
jgi:HK97 family phage prohead protease